MAYNYCSRFITSRDGPSTINLGVASVGVTALETTEEFTQRFVATLDGASLTILPEHWAPTGLLDTMVRLGAATSAQIAEAAGLQRADTSGSGLGGMTTDTSVDYDAEAATYSMPAHRAGCADPGGRCPTTSPWSPQFLPLLGEVRAENHRLLPSGRRTALQRIRASTS